MVEIVELVSRRRAGAPNSAATPRDTFQLLFFTGVQYERGCALPCVFVKSEVLEKAPPRKKVRKAS